MSALPSITCIKGRDRTTACVIEKTFVFGIDFDASTPIHKSATSCPICGALYKQTTNIEERSIVSIMVLPPFRPSISTSSSGSGTASAAFRVLLRGEQTEGVALGSTLAGTGYRQAEGWETVRQPLYSHACCSSASCRCI